MYVHVGRVISSELSSLGVTRRAQLVGGGRVRRATDALSCGGEKGMASPPNASACA